MSSAVRAPRSASGLAARCSARRCRTLRRRGRPPSYSWTSRGRHNRPSDAKAKRYLQLQLPGRFETTGGIAAQLVPLLVYDVPPDFYDRYAGRIAEVTQADVQRVARRYVHPDSLTVVIVGDRKSVEAGLIA